MRKRIWIFTGLAALLALLVWAFLPAAVEVEVATVTQGRFERHVQEDGKTRLRERYVVSSPLSGRLARIDLKQGDDVTQDMILATLTPVIPALLDERSRQEQRERIGTMEANVRRASTQIERAKVTLAQALADLKRSETLATQGFVSPTRFESDRLNVRLREKELDSARQDEHAAIHELDQSRIALRQFTPGSANQTQRPWQIKSPISGKVLKITQQSEGVVLAGAPLMELGDPGRLEVVVDLLTEDAAQISPGTLATLSNWGSPDVLQARVRLIEPAAFTKVSALGVEEQRVNAVLDITSERERWLRLGDGFKMDVRILIQTVENAVTVPVSALFPLGAQSALFVMESGRARQHRIEVLARNGKEAWVKTDLPPGTQVIVYPPSSLKEGAKVKKSNS